MIRVYHRTVPIYDSPTLFQSRVIEVHICHLHAWIIHAPNPSNSRVSRYMWSLIVSCWSIIAGVWHDSALSEILCFSSLFPYDILFLVFSLVACSIKSRSMLSLALTNDAMRLNLLILYHSLGHMTFVLMMSSFEHVVTCRIMSNSWKITWHVYYLVTSYLYQIALMTSPRNMPWHVVTCRGMSLKNLWLRYLMKPSTLLKSHFCIKLHWWCHRETHQITNTMRQTPNIRFMIKIQILNVNY